MWETHGYFFACFLRLLRLPPPPDLIGFVASQASRAHDLSVAFFYRLHLVPRGSPSAESTSPSVASPDAAPTWVHFFGQDRPNSSICKVKMLTLALIFLSAASYLIRWHAFFCGLDGRGGPKPQKGLQKPFSLPRHIKETFLFLLLPGGAKCVAVDCNHRFFSASHGISGVMR